MWQLPVKCFSTGIVESLTTARIRLSPPRGMTRSMYLSSFSRCGTRARSVDSTSCTAAGSIVRVLQRGGDDLDDRAVGVERFLPAAQDDGVAALEAQGGGVARDVGAALVEEQDDAQRHAALLDPQAVGADVAFEGLADRVDLCRDLLDAVGHRGDLLRVELQPVDERRVELRGLGGLDVLGVGVEQRLRVCRAGRLRDPLQRRRPWSRRPA